MNTAAFDSVSHRFIDTALREAKVPIKIRAMYRAIYQAASAYTTVPSADDGKQVKSKSFKIRRGVVQGDITSPLYFILALELILRIHDNVPGKGVPLGSVIIHTLGYADDAALIDFGDEEGVRRASARVTSIEAGSKADADMVISIKKTKALHVREQEKHSKTTAEEANKLCKFVCPHVQCNHRFMTKHGMMIHAGKCPNKDLYNIEQILSHRYAPAKREYLVRWDGYEAKDDMWLTRPNLHPAEVTAYEMVKGIYDYECKHRCKFCNRPFSSERGKKIHESRMHKGKLPENPQDHALGIERIQDFNNRLADKAATVNKMKAAQQRRRHVMCAEQAIDNVFTFKYLGTLFAADGRQHYDIKRRIALAMTRCGTLRHIFASPNISHCLKMRLYKAAICSIFTYGCETWDLSEDTMRTINGANKHHNVKFHKKI